MVILQYNYDYPFKFFYYTTMAETRVATDICALQSIKYLSLDRKRLLRLEKLKAEIIYETYTE